MRKLSLLLCLALFLSDTFALQVKGFLNNETVVAKISSSDVTRIVVQGDRIKSVKGVKGAYTRENDENSGEVFLQPSPLYQEHAFTVLIETEQGRHVTLLLNPVSAPSNTLMLIPKGVGNQHAARFETASDYDLTLSHLIRDMSTDTLPEGYIAIQVDPKEIYAIENMATLKLKTIYRGLKYQGQVFEVTNTQSCPITLNERTFFKPGTEAISLETITILPHKTIRVFRVVNND